MAVSPLGARRAGRGAQPGLEGSIRLKKKMVLTKNRFLPKNNFDQKTFFLSDFISCQINLGGRVPPFRVSMRVCKYASTWPKVNLAKRANVNLAQKVNLAKSEQTWKKNPWVLVTLHTPCPYCHLPTIRYLGRVLLWPKAMWSSGGQVAKRPDC